MQSELAQKARKELDAQKARYEAMLDELRRSAAGDKEFVQNELRKRIAELEKQVEEMKAQYAKERDQLLAAQAAQATKFEN